MTRLDLCCQVENSALRVCDEVEVACARMYVMNVLVPRGHEV